MWRRGGAISTLLRQQLSAWAGSVHLGCGYQLGVDGGDIGPSLAAGKSCPYGSASIVVSARRTTLAMAGDPFYQVRLKLMPDTCVNFRQND
jgi:hypothetical protein